MQAMSDLATETPVKFHLSLNVTDLGRSIAFYRVLFGVEPAKRHDDYAKFELDDPPVVFSLVPRRPGPGGSLSHLGLRVSRRRRSSPGRRSGSRPPASARRTRTARSAATPGRTRSGSRTPTATSGRSTSSRRTSNPPSSAAASDGPARPAGADSGRPVVWEHFVTEPA